MKQNRQQHLNSNEIRIATIILLIFILKVLAN